MPQPIDSDTPKSAYSRKGFDGFDYELVFSDEFNTPGRTFYPGLYQFCLFLPPSFDVFPLAASSGGLLVIFFLPFCR